MRKISLLSVLLIILFHVSYGQGKEVTGTVTDAKDNSPIIGATVKAKGSNSTVITKNDGSFSIRVNPKVKELVISFVGYGDKEVAITGSALTVSLATSEQTLNEVVVVGYGTKLRRDITGSVSKVSAKEIANTPATSFESAIQGRAAGVQVSQQNGKLGQGINIRIRGASSVTAGNEPLYVVDGIPLTTDDLSNSGAPTDALADLNMNDIESIEILKDASSAAIYGSRASNGVVLITTKKGKAGTSKIELGYFTGTQKPTGKRKFMNATQWVNFFQQSANGAAKQDFAAGLYNTLEDAQADYASYTDETFTNYSGGNDDWKTQKVNTNWQNQAFQHAPISQYDLNISGGNEKTKFFLSGQYLDQTGIVLKNSYKRYSARLSVDHQVRSWLTAGMNVSFTRSINNRVSDDDQFTTPLQIVALSPITPIIDPRTGLTSGALDVDSTSPYFGTPNHDYPVYYNPLLSAQDAFYKTLGNRTFGNVYLSANLFSGLTFRSEFGMDQLNQTEEDYRGKLTVRDLGVPNGHGYFGTTQVLNINTNNYFNYKTTINDLHDIDVVLGMSYQSRSFDLASATGEEFPSDAFKKLDNAASKVGAGSSSTSNTLVSYFSRINYKFNDKYLLALSGRIDGSSRFGANHRYGFFPAASAGWIVSQEEFLKNTKWLSLLKIKASYGLTGNDNIPDFASRGLYSGNGAYGGQAGTRPSQIANPDLKWESTLGSDIGIEAAILNSRISVEVDYYNRNTKDLLLDVQIPGTTGFSTQTKNVGKLNNKGIEFSITTVNVSSKNFRWTTNLNFGANKNKIVNLGGQVIGSDVNKAEEGQPIGVFVAREFAGADPANGDALYYKNVKGANGSIDHSTTNDYNQATDVVIGNPTPKFIYGFDNTFTYAGFDLDVLLQGVNGNKIYNGGGEFMSASGSNGFDNQTVDQLSAWQKPGDKTMVPEARLFYGNGVSNSSRYISDGSYLRVKSIVLGYNLPKALIVRWKLDRIRLYARAQNLFTITKYKGWDPEVNTDYLADNIHLGYDFYSAPQLKSIVFGINVGF